MVETGATSSAEGRGGTSSTAALTPMTSMVRPATIHCLVLMLRIGWKGVPAMTRSLEEGRASAVHLAPWRWAAMAAMILSATRVPIRS